MELKHYTYQNGLKEEDLSRFVEDYPQALTALKPTRPLEAICAIEGERVYLRGANDALIVVEKEHTSTESATSISEKLGRLNPFNKRAHEIRISETPYETIRGYFGSSASHGLRAESVIIDNGAFESAINTGKYANLVNLISAAQKK